MFLLKYEKAKPHLYFMDKYETENKNKQTK